ncbi:MAG: hypothetical protein M1823_002792 [Watsoniomyces obsoletus]|nr:MAG: hypothetical protein M1823_002792 [Watsoniomyces obsoletus]
MSVPLNVAVIVLALSAAFFVVPLVIRAGGRLFGWSVKQSTQDRRKLLFRRVKAEQKAYGLRKSRTNSRDDDEWEQVEKSTSSITKNGVVADEDWEGVIGFFHPFCNAGGGGERVLWAAIQATQKRWPNAVCLVYSGDPFIDLDKSDILSRVSTRFNINLHPPTVVFMCLLNRRFVLSSSYPYFTLLGQSLGSLVLAYEAFTRLVPDIFIDTMGYSFTLALSKLLFPSVPTGAYVHYPTISTDMLESLRKGGQGINGGAGSGFKGFVKRWYWQLFARMYSWVGGQVDVVMVNSSWTQGHIRSLWGRHRKGRGVAAATAGDDIDVLYPPVAVEQLEKQIEVSSESKQQRKKILLYIAQFRPEKNHSMILEAFAKLLQESSSIDSTKKPKLVLIGSIRNSEDATRVYELRLLAHELKVKEQVEFVCDASWPEILKWLRQSSVGVNGMWNEHFGIGVVEYQAAGLISVVHNSGGPKMDIVVDYDGGVTGFHATTASEFAAAFTKALSLPEEETLAMRLRARASAKRFTENMFARGWLEKVEQLVEMRRTGSSRKRLGRNN